MIIAISIIAALLIVWHLLLGEFKKACKLLFIGMGVLSTAPFLGLFFAGAVSSIVAEIIWGRL